MKGFLTFGGTVAVLVLSLLVHETKSVCCPPDNDGLCEDVTIGTPCCGYGPCNFFCCNCDYGCRTLKSSQDGFLLIDTSGDGKISLEEAKAYIKSGMCGNPNKNLPLVDEKFEEMDLNLDGFLSRDEIDS